MVIKVLVLLGLIGVMVSLKAEGSYPKIIGIVLLFQGVFFVFIIKYSWLFLFLFEFWLVFSFLWGSVSEEEGFAVVWFHLLFVFSSTMVYVFVGLGTEFPMELLFFFLGGKIWLEGFCFYLASFSEFLKNKVVKFFLVFYVFNSKVLTLMYLLLFKGVGNKYSLFMMMFSYQGLFFVILVWSSLMLLSLVLLLSKDLEAYLGVSVCLSQFLMLFSGFFSFSMSLICFFSDLMVFLGVLYMLFFSVSFLFYSSWGSMTSFLVFVFVSQVLGVPPFPTFYLEVNFLFLLFFSFGSGHKVLFLLFFYFFLSLQFVLLFSWVGSGVLWGGFNTDLSHIQYTMYILVYMFFLVFSIYLSF